MNCLYVSRNIFMDFTNILLLIKMINITIFAKNKCERQQLQKGHFQICVANYTHTTVFVCSKLKIKHKIKRCKTNLDFADIFARLKK